MSAELKKLIIDGIEVPNMYSDYFNLNALTYTKSPVRSNAGAITNINNLTTFFVERLWVDFKFVTLRDYQFILKLINKPEFSIYYLDIESGNYITRMFYLEPLERQRIVAFGSRFYGVTNFVLSFIGTLNDVK